MIHYLKNCFILPNIRGTWFSLDKDNLLISFWFFYAFWTHFPKFVKCKILKMSFNCDQVHSSLNIDITISLLKSFYYKLTLWFSQSMHACIWYDSLLLNRALKVLKNPKWGQQNYKDEFISIGLLSAHDSMVNFNNSKYLITKS